MCECCATHGQAHQGHVHVNGVDCAACFADLERALTNLPGIIEVEYIKDNAQAKVTFDKRIVKVTRLEEILDENGFAVS